MPNKSILMSKTFWGAVLALIAVLFPDIWMSLGISENGSMLADKIVGGLGGALAIYGRLVATHAVSILPGK